MMRSLLLLLLATFLYIPSAHVDASSHGMEGYSEVGCNCHGEAPGENAMVSITGIPSVYEETYLLTVALSGGQGHSSCTSRLHPRMDSRNHARACRRTAPPFSLTVTTNRQTATIGHWRPIHQAERI